MALLDQLKEAQRTSIRGPRCAFKNVYDKLSKDDAVVLSEWIHNMEIPATVISVALRAEGHQVSADSVQRHRRRVCRCDDV
jgi:predicted metallopeptidase